MFYKFTNDNIYMYLLISWVLNLPSCQHVDSKSKTTKKENGCSEIESAQDMYKQVTQEYD